MFFLHFFVFFLADFFFQIFALAFSPPFSSAHKMINRALSHRAASTSTSASSSPSCCCKVAPSPRATRSAHASLQSSITFPSSSTSLPPLRRCRRSPVLLLASATPNDNEKNESPSPQLSEDVWALKPAWCQPYSIVGTGLFVVGGAKVVGGVWLALAAAAAVSVWWWAFLIEYPVAYRDYVRGMKSSSGSGEVAEEFE